MSELINAQRTECGFRWQLLTTVSALALLASINVQDAKAADGDADHPIVWIELGGELERVTGQGEPFAPGFLAANPTSPVLQPATPLQAQNPRPFSFTEDGKISIQPDGSDWVFSVAVNYGKSSDIKHVHHQTSRGFAATALRSSGAPTVADFADTQVHGGASHAILDFAVGKDVGLGMFGREGSSVLGFGVRFAQFASKTSLDIRARPDLHFKYVPLSKGTFPVPYFHTYHATGRASRSFHGLGPSISWNASTPFAGNPQAGELTFDWGANAAILFGKQRAHVQHQESAHYKSKPFKKYYSTIYQHATPIPDRLRSVTVPNVGGFAGLSIRYSDVKFSLGYRGDFFFGAMDAGIDKRKSEMLGFYGPFASVSVGIGG